MEQKKVILLGNAKSGKSCATAILKGRPLHGKYLPTLGIEVIPYLSPNSRVYHLWELAGNPKFLFGFQLHLQGANGVVIFDGGEEIEGRSWEILLKEHLPGVPFTRLEGTLENKVEHLRTLLV